MKTLVSKRHFLNFYVANSLGTLIFWGLATVLLVMYIRHTEIAQMSSKYTLLPVFSFGLYVFGGYSFCRYFKNVPNITLNKDCITFNKEIFLLTDIGKIELTGKRPFSYVLYFPMEATSLTFKNGKTKNIFDEMYANSWEIKLFLKQVVIEKNDFQKECPSKINFNAAENDFYQTFKGNQFISLRGILLWGMIGVFVYQFAYNEKPGTVGVGLLAFAFILSLLWIILVSRQMYYFQVSSHYLVVRNHNLFWRKKIYNLADIKEIVFDTQGKLPNCLRLITKDFKYKLYPAGTLRDKTWLALKTELETYSIEVRNECI